MKKPKIKPLELVYKFVGFGEGSYRDFKTFAPDETAAEIRRNLTRADEHTYLSGLTNVAFEYKWLKPDTKLQVTITNQKVK